MSNQCPITRGTMSKSNIVVPTTNFNTKFQSLPSTIVLTNDNVPETINNQGFKTALTIEETTHTGTHSTLTMLETSESKDAIGLVSNKVLPTKTTKSRTIKGVKTYVPESLELGDSFKFKDHIHYLVGRIYWKQLEGRLTWDSYVSLKAAYLRENIPQFAEVWKWCVRLRIVERSSHYVQGSQSYGYRLTEQYRGQTHRLRTITNRAIVKRDKAIETKHRDRPMKQYMKTQLERLTVDQAEFQRLFGNDPNRLYYAAHLQTITDGLIRCEPDDFSGRYHHNISNMFKGCRKVLRVAGEPESLGEIDIKNSQPLFLGLAALNAGVEDRLYLTLCEQGLLYEHIAAGLGISRESAKGEMMLLLFSKNGFRSSAKTFFSKEFPQIAKYMSDIKDTDHVRLARHMQKAEREFIIDTCCNRLKAQDLFFVTIHDSILARKADCPTVLNVMQDEFSKKGINPRLTWADLCSQTA